jgi:hypothetical protein
MEHAIPASGKGRQGFLRHFKCTDPCLPFHVSATPLLEEGIEYLFQYTALITIFGYRANYLFLRDIFAFHTKYLVAILQIKIDTEHGKLL